MGQVQALPAGPRWRDQASPGRGARRPARPADGRGSRRGPGHLGNVAATQDLGVPHRQPAAHQGRFPKWLRRRVPPMQAGPERTRPGRVGAFGRDPADLVRRSSFQANARRARPEDELGQALDQAFQAGQAALPAHDVFAAVARTRGRLNRRLCLRRQRPCTSQPSAVVDSIRSLAKTKPLAAVGDESRVRIVAVDEPRLARSGQRSRVEPRTRPARRWSATRVLVWGCRRAQGDVRMSRVNTYR